LLLFHHRIAIYSRVLFPPCQTTISTQIVPSAQYCRYCACTIIKFKSTADLQQSAISTMPIYYFHPNSTIHIVPLLLYHHQLQSTAMCYFYHAPCQMQIYYYHLNSAIQIVQLLLFHHRIAIYISRVLLLFPPCQTTISTQIVPSTQYRCYCACTIIKFESTADLQQSAISTMPIYYFHPNSTIHIVPSLFNALAASSNSSVIM
jgi:hypothetical protein